MTYKKSNNIKSHFEFSKLIIIPETILVWYVAAKTIYFIELAIQSGYTASLPYLTTLLTAVFAAYGTSVAFYYNKAKGENVKKIENAGRLDLAMFSQNSESSSVDCDPLIDNESLKD